MESKLGEGSTFYVRLPLTEGGEKEAPSSPSPESTSEASIMLVDVNPEVAEVLELMLTQMGHHVAVVTKGGEAITQFERGDYRLVIADLGMRDISRWDVARAVKQTRPGTPVLLMTGRGIKLDSKEMREAGVDGVIAKPFGKQALGAELARLLNAAV